jgi:hypothetical protein
VPTPSETQHDVHVSGRRSANSFTRQPWADRAPNRRSKPGQLEASEPIWKINGGCGAERPSVVVTSLQDHHVVAVNEVDQPVFFADAA